MGITGASARRPRRAQDAGGAPRRPGSVARAPRPLPCR